MRPGLAAVLFALAAVPAGAQIFIDGNCADIAATPGVFSMLDPSDAGNPPGCIIPSCPPGNLTCYPVLGESGFDMRNVFLYIDPANDRLYIAMSTYGVPGDADGDGNPSSNLTNRRNNQCQIIPDVPGVGFDDEFRFQIDFDYPTPNTYDLEVRLNNNAITFYNLQTFTLINPSQFSFALGSTFGANNCVEWRVDNFNSYVNAVNPAYVGDFSWRVRFFSDTDFDAIQEDQFVFDAELPPVIACVGLTLGPNPVNPGGTLTGQYRVTNDGPGSASFNFVIPRPAQIISFTLVAPVPAGVSIDGGGNIVGNNVTLAQLATMTLNFTASVSGGASGTITMTASLTPIAPAVRRGQEPCIAAVLVRVPRVPTLSGWGLILLGLGLGGALVRRAARRAPAA